MLAYHTVMRTPQYPEGRDVVIIANDVTVQSGSFGVQEDEVRATPHDIYTHTLYTPFICAQTPFICTQDPFRAFFLSPAPVKKTKPQPRE